MKLNITDPVRIKILPAGEKLWDAAYAYVRERTGLSCKIKRDADGWTEMPLWQVMEIFGPGCGMGRGVPFETTIEIIKPKGGDA